MNTLLARERYDAPRNVFDGREAHYMRLMDEGAQASHLVYEYLNTSAAGLVEKPEDMPGVTLGFGHWKTGFIEIERPPVFFSSKRPERLRLELTPPPLLYRAFGGDLDALVHHMRRLSEDVLRSLRMARTRPIVGAHALRRLHPWGEPRTLRETGGERVPTFRIGARGILAAGAHRAAAMETTEWRRAYATALRARLDGDTAAVFPYGTYEMRRFHNAPTEEVPFEDAILAQPGPLLADVRAELRGCDREQLRELAREIVNETREAFADEATDIVEHHELDCSGSSSTPSAAGAQAGGDEAASPAGDIEAVELGDRTDDGRRLDVVETHRFGALPEAGTAARVVVLRDRGRGRDDRGGRHGSDPPD